MKRPLAVLLASALALAAATAEAQKPVRVRGTITALEGNVLSVKSRDGQDLRIELTEKASVATARAITLADLKPGTYVGTTTRKRADGVLVALEIHTLPPTAAAGQRPWDLAPGTMMTNANIASVAQAEGGQELIVEHKGGSEKVVVPPGTPIVTTSPADRTALKPGEYVFMAAQQHPDGKLTVSGRIQVSKDGVKPPQ
jgi:hypothetical protein